jgi:hypothetical protein
VQIRSNATRADFFEAPLLTRIILLNVKISVIKALTPSFTPPACLCLFPSHSLVAPPVPPLVVTMKHRAARRLLASRQFLRCAYAGLFLGAAGVLRWKPPACP